MPNYTIFFTGEPKFENADDAKANMEKYMVWMKGVGDKFVNRGTPLGKATIVTSEKVIEDKDEHKLTGYAIIKADTREEVIQIVKDCPFLIYGDIKICENREMKQG